MIFHNGCQLALLTVLLVGVVSGARIGTQTAWASCNRNTDSTIHMVFRIELNNDPRGALQVYNAPQNVICTIEQPLGWYTVSTEAAFSNPNTSPGQSGCGYYYDSLTQSYIWRFKYYELAGRTDADGGLNRIWTVQCDASNINNLVATVTLTPTTPDLDQVVTPYRPDVEYYIVAETSPGSNVYSKVDGTNLIPTQTRLKLRLVLRYGTYNANRYSSIGGLGTIVAPASTFGNSRTFLDLFGCPNSDFFNTNNVNYGFIRVPPTEAGTSVRETAPFPAFKFDFVNSQYVYFRTIFTMCMGAEDNVPHCNNPCQNQLRKRRQVNGADGDNSDVNEAVVYIRVGDEPENTKTDGQTKSDNTVLYGIIGACIGVGALLCVLLCVALIVFMGRRKRRRNNTEKKSPPTAFVNE